MYFWPFSKSKFNLKSDRVNLVAQAGPIECLLYLTNVRAIQYKLGPERLTRLGNSNVLRLLVIVLFQGWKMSDLDNFDKFSFSRNAQVTFAEKPQIIRFFKL